MPGRVYGELNIALFTTRVVPQYCVPVRVGAELPGTSVRTASVAAMLGATSESARSSLVSFGLSLAIHSSIGRSCAIAYCTVLTSFPHVDPVVAVSDSPLGIITLMYWKQERVSYVTSCLTVCSSSNSSLIQ